jgi:hypothetical protein
MKQLNMSEKLIVVLAIITIILLLTSQSAFSLGCYGMANFTFYMFCIYGGVTALATIAHLIDIKNK